MIVEKHFPARSYLLARGVFTKLFFIIVVAVLIGLPIIVLANAQAILYLRIMAILAGVELCLLIVIPYMSSEEYTDKCIVKGQIDAVTGKVIERVKYTAEEDEQGQIVTSYILRVKLEEPPEDFKNPEELEEEPLEFVGTKAYNLVSKPGDKVKISVLRSYDRKGHLLKIFYKLKSPVD